MPLESGTTIAELNPAWPLGSDPKAQGDDHLRLIKSILQNDAVALSDTGSAEIVGADATAGWQCWGDTLIQWGIVVTNAGGNATITFPKTFKATPGVTLTPDSSGAFLLTAQTTSLSTGAANVAVSNAGAFGAFTVRWIAVGEALDVDKKPKTVQTIGGAELQEFHDPAGAASWRVVGNTLECWGARTYPANNGASTYIFPKTFNNEPAVTVTPDLFEGGNDDTMTAYHFNPPTTQALNVALRRLTGAGNPAPPTFDVIVRYHAIGEWDGVS